MNCPKCDHENPEGVKFCGECGAPLADAKVDKPRSFHVEPSPPSGGPANAHLKNAILWIILAVLLVIVVICVVTCGSCMAAFSH